MVYQRSDEYINRQLDRVPPERHAHRRLELDFGALLVGPTCGQNADRLAEAAARDPRALALAMKEAAERYLESTCPACSEPRGSPGCLIEGGHR